MRFHARSCDRPSASDGVSQSPLEHNRPAMQRRTMSSFCWFRETLSCRSRGLLTAAFSAGIVHAAACAQTYATAGELRDDCAPRMLQGERDALSAAGECISFIDGARGFAQTFETEHHVPLLSIPERVSTLELAALFVRSVGRGPGTRADPAAAALYRTLDSVFSCPA